MWDAVGWTLDDSAELLLPSALCSDHGERAIDHYCMNSILRIDRVFKRFVHFLKDITGRSAWPKQGCSSIAAIAQDWSTAE